MQEKLNSEQEYQTFDEFYPFYLSQHENQTNRRLHFIGSTIALLYLISCILTFDFLQIIWVPIIGYGFAWVGHFFFEQNKPATFKYPWFSLQGDMRMWKQIATGEMKF